MNWSALVPIKSALARKSRLASHLSLSERVTLSERMLERVVEQLHDQKSITRVLLLSPGRIGRHAWLQDEGRGLNEELARARAECGGGPLLVIHADLPLLQTDDVTGVLDAAARAGQAIAPDRHRRGTNAIAIADGAAVDWQFGAGSFARHLDALPAGHAVVEEPGLLLDCDTHADLLIAEAGGFRWRDGLGGGGFAATLGRVIA